MQTVLRVWFLATGVLLAGWAIWAFAPVLVPLLGLAALMIIPVAAIVAFARWLERKRGAPHPPLE